MEEDKGKKKYRYTYYTATGKEVIEVDEKWYEILRQADRDMYNNNRREEYKSYLLNSYIDESSGEEHDAWETVADKETLQIESDICVKMDEDWVIDCLSKRNKYIYEKCVIEGVSQSAVAKELNLTQSSVSRRLKKILYAMEWQRLKDGRSKREIKEELDFRQMERANDTELWESVLVDYFLGSILEEQDLINFIGWFYSAKELKRYTFKAWRKLGKVNVEEYVTNFLLRCSMPLRSYIINTYGHLQFGFQFMFMELFKEMYRRMELFPTPKGNSYIKANEELKKIVKRLKKKTTEDEFIESRVLPILEKEEKARIKNFQKIYGRKVGNVKNSS